MDILRQADFSVYKENAKDFMADDTAFTLANYEKCKRIGAIPELLLFYRFSEGSVTAKYNPKRIDNSVNIHVFSMDMLNRINDTAEESRHYVDNVFLASIIEACKLLFASDNPYSYKVGEVRRVVETEVMKDLMGKSKEAVSVLRTIIEYVLAETQKCTNITTEDVEQLKYINGLLKIYMAEGE